MVDLFWRRAAPLALVVLLGLSGCDDEEEKPPEVEVQVPKGTVVKVTHTDEESEMIVVAELAAFTGLVVWALFGRGATKRRQTIP